VLALSGCSPDFDWRVVSVADGAVTGVLPARPHTETRAIDYGDQRLDLSLTMAEANDVWFALGHAPLPEALRRDKEAARALAREMIMSFYRNLGVPPPPALPALGERFVVEGEGPGAAMRIEAVVGVNGTSLMEAMVMGTRQASDRAPVHDFWNALKMSPLD
jgi:hypothetical protein